MEGLGWLSAWAKAPWVDGKVVGWLPLFQHLDDSAGVAGLLVDEWVSRQVVERIAEDLPDGALGVRRLACWFAGVHDVGKASPAFAVQVPQLADRMRRYGLVASPRLADDPERSRVSHGLVGHCAVRDWLVGELGFARRGEARQWAVIVGGHHGVPPEDSHVQFAARRADLAGTGVWTRARMDLLERATAAVGGRSALERYRGVPLSRPSQVLLTAIVVMADWIASNTDFFELEPISTAGDPVVPIDERAASRATAARVARAWSMLDMPRRWSVSDPTGDVHELYRARFDGPPDRGARRLQEVAFQAARAQTTPGMVIIEAPMGSGKTEAALLAAEVVAASSGASGCFVALPTQATTDAMFARVNDWVRRLPALDRRVSVYLAHGKAALNDQFQGLPRAGRIAEVGVDEAGDNTLVAHTWLYGRKKGMLASFVVGTIDQVLFAGLMSRHLVLRHLALAGKVVIIDEVHAYDVYMSQYLHRVLHWLGAYRVPVVLLSATLPAARRDALLNAYAGGRSGAPSVGVPDRVGYPVVVGSDGSPPRRVPVETKPVTVQLDHLPDDLDTLVDYLRTWLADGGCAAVVRNTVARVQETAERLIAEFGADNVTIDHGRFLACDRARIDRDLLRRFGPTDTGRARPRHIVVASQVLECSLDIDLDLMVTDLAPLDLVLQRIGRSHRHTRVRPPGLRTARCALVGVADWSAEPVVTYPSARRVYSPHTLLRAAALLGPHARHSVRLPNDIQPLVQAAYDDAPVGPASWQPAMEAARQAAHEDSTKRADNARAYLLGTAPPDTGSLVGWIRGGVGDADDSRDGAAQVRDGTESLEVLVAQRDADGGLLTPDWIGTGAGQPVPLDSEIPRPQARTLAACTLRLPYAMCHSGVIDDVIAALEANHFTSFQQSPLLAGQLVLVLDHNRTTRLHHGRADFTLTYDLRRGLLHEQTTASNS